MGQSGPAEFASRNSHTQPAAYKIKNDYIDCMITNTRACN